MYSARDLFVIIVVCFSVVAPALLAAEPSVIVSGVSPKATTFTLSALKQLEQIEVEVEDHGKKARFRGVALAEILSSVAVPLGKLRGENLADYVLIGASDGYRAVFALPEFDSQFTDRQIILALERDGKPLSSGEGPFRIIVPGEKRAGRWVRQVTSIAVLKAPPPSK